MLKNCVKLLEPSATGIRTPENKSGSAQLQRDSGRRETHIKWVYDGLRRQAIGMPIAGGALINNLINTFVLLKIG